MNFDVILQFTVITLGTLLVIGSLILGKLAYDCARDLKFSAPKENTQDIYAAIDERRREKLRATLGI